MIGRDVASDKQDEIAADRSKMVCECHASSLALTKNFNIDCA
jgi:hypothetical protein